MKNLLENRKFVNDCMGGKLGFLKGLLENYKVSTGEELPEKELKKLAKAANGSSSDLIRSIQKRIMDHGK